jgi:hypothetical protein
MSRQSNAFLLAALLVIGPLGCAPRSRTGATAAAIGGGAAALAGAALLFSLKQPGNDSDGNGVDDFPENDIACALGGCLIAVALIAAGAVMGVTGVIAMNQAAAPVPIAGPGKPPEALGHLDVRLVAPLPEMPCDDETLRLARQARSAARRGHCDAAMTVVEHIRERDAAYADALIGSRALARCRRPAAAVL